MIIIHGGPSKCVYLRDEIRNRFSERLNLHGLCCMHYYPDSLLYVETKSSYICVHQQHNSNRTHNIYLTTDALDYVYIDTLGIL